MTEKSPLFDWGLLSRGVRELRGTVVPHQKEDARRMLEDAELVAKLAIEHPDQLKSLRELAGEAEPAD